MIPRDAVHQIVNRRDLLGLMMNIIPKRNLGLVNHLALVYLLAAMSSSCGDGVDERLRYLQQQPPSMIPEIFAPDLISKDDEYEFGSVFNAEATEFYFGVNANGKEEIRFSKLEDGHWSEPVTLLSHPRYGYNDPFLSPDENRLFFISRRALDGVGDPKDYDIWYVEKSGENWSEPINAGPKINSEGNEYYISFTSGGTMYFASNKRAFDFDIYYAGFRDGEFQEASPLGSSINTQSYEADVFIDPDESYLIFCADRPEGLGRGDLYISFKQTDGTWTPSKNMGQPINSEDHELCPFVSKDGKYFFYTSREDIYWVDARILEELRD